MCRIGAKDVNAWMVAEAWAFACRKYSRRYIAGNSSHALAWMWRDRANLTNLQGAGMLSSSN